MERTHGQLSTRFTNGLGSDNPHRFTNLYGLSGSHIGTITFCTHTNVRTAGKDRTNLNFFNSRFCHD